MAMGILHNEADAEDAVSAAFFSISRCFEKISNLPCHEMKAYAVIVVRNKALNIYARNKRESERTVHLCDEQIHDEGYLRQSFSELDEALTALDERYKEVVVLYYYYGFTAEEAAQLLGIHPDTVRHRAMRAKRLLKEALEKGDTND